MSAHSLFELRQAGQSPWLDNLSRELLRSGKLKSLIEKGLMGVTSNPSIFEKAISQPGGGYDGEIASLLKRGKSTLEVYDALTLADIRETCDLFAGVYEETKGEHGFVSLEVLPGLAHEEEETVREALRLFKAVHRPNCMIKVPATPEGIPAVRQLIASGVNINITLMFSLKHYRDVANAYLDGLEDFKKRGGNLGRVHSVASVFVSRIDTLIDKRLEKIGGEALELKGKAAVANSKIIYREFKSIFGSEKFHKLQASGARIQKVLWGSTSAKNPSYPDLLYVENLIGPETVNTRPTATLEAFLDHGRVPGPTIEQHLDPSEEAIARLKRFGIDLIGVGEELQREGVRLFSESFDLLMQSIEKRREQLFSSKLKMVYAGMRESGLDSFREGLDKRTKEFQAQGYHKRFLEGDPTLWKADTAHKEVIANRLGWLKVADWALGKLYELDALSSHAKAEGIKDVVLLGMGGSSLAPEVMSLVFKGRKGPRFHVLDTTDPAALLNTARKLSVKTVLFIVASKSGSTIETVSQFKFFYEWAKKKLGKKATDQAVGLRFMAITDPGSSLEKTAGEKKFRNIFLNPSNIGGRYSALSFFGLVPAALLGLDARAIVRSARQFYSFTEKTIPLRENAGIYLGILLGELAKKGKNKITFWSTPSLASFATWTEQLIAESTGKEGKGIVPVEGEEPASAEVYGSDRIFVVMKMKGESAAALAAPLAGIKKAGFPVLEFEWPEPAAIGAEFLRWEIATTIAGSLLDVNPFDEPNVQESKDNTARLLKEMTGKKKLAKPKDESDAKHLSEFLAKVRKGGYVALLAYMERHAKTIKALNQIRRTLRDELKVPVLVGFGPRYLHSIGQLYKGGEPSGAFIEFLVKDAKDVPVPGAPYTFSQLKKAQALGDLQAFLGRKLPALVVQLGRDPVSGLAAFERNLKRVMKSK